MNQITKKDKSKIEDFIILFCTSIVPVKRNMDNDKNSETTREIIVAVAAVVIISSLFNLAVMVC